MEPAHLPRDTRSEKQYGRWSGRFTWAAIIQGAAVAILTALLAAFTAGTIYPFKMVEMMLATPAIGFSEVTALAGLGLYLVVGVIGTGLSAQFYHHFESRAGRPYRGVVTNALAWSHLVLMNVGVAAASLLMIYAGFIGDFAVTPVELGGYGMTIEQVSQQILNPLVVPVAAMLLVTVAGAIAGGTGFVVNYFKR
ncbi:MAG: hypothetical protein QXJ74_05560 [Nitrososphaera sp.]|uniref:hypothetical protein n=1 Tax=Nitrososphaera sp. TaxID=1971748 RepID=UPI0017E4E29B|nr:hypothetical protein [Nitrososphaera sp.]NWG36031.1 hypothetical protein [Nitrososphaera sp.]